MNYQEAQLLVKEHHHLMGTEFKGKTISKLLITPLKEAGIARLLYNDSNDISSAKFYEGFEAFEIWVIFDLEDWLLTGVIDKMQFQELLVQVTES